MHWREQEKWGEDEEGREQDERYENKIEEKDDKEISRENWNEVLIPKPTPKSQYSNPPQSSNPSHMKVCTEIQRIESKTGLLEKWPLLSEGNLIK